MDYLKRYTINFNINGNEEELVFFLKKTCNKFDIQCLNSNEEELASLSFVMLKSQAFLCYIALTEDSKNLHKYQNFGICSFMLKVMETLCAKNNVYDVEGRLTPFGVNGEYAESFFIKNGYSLNKFNSNIFFNKSIVQKEAIKLDNFELVDGEMQNLE